MIISREEAQDQIQIYTDEIVKEDPGDLEDNMKGSCIGLTRVNEIGYNCMDNSENIIEYCSYYLCIPGCKIKCEYYDGKEEGCRDLDHCGWHPIGKSGRGECLENCGAAPTCYDNDYCESGESCSCQDCHGKHDGCPDENICSRREESEDYRCLGYIGEDCNSNDNCTEGLTCKSGPSGPKKCGY